MTIRRRAQPRESLGPVSFGRSRNAAATAVEESPGGARRWRAG